MRTYFLADTHFDAQNAALCRAIFQTLDQIQADPDKSALYLLGDGWEMWLGFADDEQLLHKLSALDIPIYFQYGNRDFLLPKALLAQYGIELLPERFVLELGSKRLLLEHGDLLCTDDVGYQRLRKIVRNPLIQKIYFALPQSCKQKIATKLRGQSSGNKAWVDVNEAEVQRVLKQYDADFIIHGHVHRAATHTKRFVLGDFRQNAHGEYEGVGLIYDGNFKMLTLPLRDDMGSAGG